MTVNFYLLLFYGFNHGTNFDAEAEGGKYSKKRHHIEAIHVHGIVAE